MTHSNDHTLNHEILYDKTLHITPICMYGPLLGFDWQKNKTNMLYISQIIVILSWLDVKQKLF